MPASAAPPRAPCHLPSPFDFKHSASDLIAKASSAREIASSSGRADIDLELARLRAAENAAHARYLRLSRRGGTPALDEARRIAEDLWKDAAEAVHNY